VMDKGCDVVGIAERPGLNQAWKQRVDVVAVGCCLPVLSRQCPVNARSQDVIVLFVGEAGCAKEGCPAVMLSLGCGW